MDFRHALKGLEGSGPDFFLEVPIEALALRALSFTTGFFAAEGLGVSFLEEPFIWLDPTFPRPSDIDVFSGCFAVG